METSRKCSDCIYWTHDDYRDSHYGRRYGSCHYERIKMQKYEDDFCHHFETKNEVKE
ncbi:hypothetical protein M0R19_05820 [Candidatus Pacearchaeota archaeon]|jgi:hypothetical protein|nr:hypothetical protein [Candidatus Pacearchaeota archaeon]